MKEFIYFLIGKTKLHLNLDGKMSVRGGFGCASLASAAIFLYELSKNESNRKILSASGAGCVTFGGIYLFLDERDKSHEVIMQRIKSRGKTHDSKNSRTNDTATETETDPEEQAKTQDKKIKIKISKALGLFETDNTSWGTLVNEDERANPKKTKDYLAGEILKKGDRLALVSETGIGKSMVAMQIGLAVSEGRSCELFGKDSAHQEAMPVDYYDAELDEDDLIERYAQYNTCPNFNYKKCKYRTLYHLLDDLWNRYVDFSADALLVLDNLFALMPSLTTEETRTFLDGLSIIQEKFIGKGFRLTIIIVTHTIKSVKGIPDIKDVAGSANLTRFAKSVVSLVDLPVGNFALVQNKIRHGSKKDAYVVHRSNEGYLHGEFVKRASRAELDEMINSQHTETEASKNVGYPDEVVAKIWELHSKEKMSYRDIAKEIEKIYRVSISHTKIGKIINDLKKADEQNRVDVGE